MDDDHGSPYDMILQHHRHKFYKSNCTDPIFWVHKEEYRQLMSEINYEDEASRSRWEDGQLSPSLS